MSCKRFRRSPTSSLLCPGRRTVPAAPKASGRANRAERRPPESLSGGRSATRARKSKNRKHVARRGAGRTRNTDRMPTTSKPVADQRPKENNVTNDRNYYCRTCRYFAVPRLRGNALAGRRRNRRSWLPVSAVAADCCRNGRIHCLRFPLLLLGRSKMLSEVQIRDAIDVVLGWGLSDAALGDAVIAQAELLSAQARD